MNDFIQSLPSHRVNIALFLVFMLSILVILLYLAQVANPTDAHHARKQAKRNKRNKRFDEDVKALDQHHGGIEYRRSVIRPLHSEDDDEPL